MKLCFFFIICCLLGAFSACKSGSPQISVENSSLTVVPTSTPEPTPAASPSPAIPNLQDEITDSRFQTTTSPLAAYDFKNHTYPLPRGWQNPDGSDIKLAGGNLDPISEWSDDGEPTPDAKANRRIGMSFVGTRFMDVNGDGNDEAAVILKIITEGSAVPQVVYIYQWKDDKPDLIWFFRTGDRADGGLKDLRVENGQVIVELFGQDRFLLGEIETGRITGDEEQLCCPTFFTRTTYKWNGRNFQMQGKRLTFAIAEPTAAPTENMGEIVNGKPQPPTKKRRR